MVRGVEGQIEKERDESGAIKPAKLLRSSMHKNRISEGLTKLGFLHFFRRF